MYAITSPVPQFFDLSGDPLDAGKLYIGTAGSNPITSPVTVYWDDAGTQPAAQPIRTVSGYPARNGKPARVYVGADDFSMAVMTRSDVVVTTEMSVLSSATLRADLAATGGSALVGSARSGTVQDFIDALPSFADGTPATVVAAHPLGKIRVPVGTNTASDLQLSGQSLDGQGLGAILKAGAGATSALELGYVNAPGQWARKSIRDLVIDGNAKASNGATYSAASATHISGRWSFDGVVVKACMVGVHKPNGNIGNSYRACNFVGNDFGVYAVGQASPIMHAGCDTYEDTEFSSNALAAVYYDSPVPGSGGLFFGKNTIFEANPGFGVFIKNWFSSTTPITFDGVWFENNATGGGVTINGTSYTPKDVRLENVAQAVMRDGIMPKVELVNSALHIDNCLIDLDVTAIEADADSVVTVTNAHINGGVFPLEIQNLTRSRRVSGNFAAAWWAPIRNVFISDTTNKLLSDPFTAITAFTGSASVNTTVQTDGRIYATCGELTIGASQTLLRTTAPTLTAGKWAVFTLDIKHVSGLLSELTPTVSNTIVLAPNMRSLLSTEKWRTVAGLAKVDVGGTVRLSFANGATGPQVVRLSAMQVLQFDTQQEAIDYYNGRGFVL